MRRLLILPLLLAFAAPGVHAADPPPDTKEAAATRDKLKKSKVTCDYKETIFKDVIDDLQEQTKLSFRLDTQGGVSLNRKITYKCTDKPLDEVLDEIFKKEEYGYFVISGEKNAYNGRIQVKQGNERGYPEGVTAPKDTPAPKAPPKDPPKDPKPKDPPKDPKPDDNVDRLEEAAASKLKAARSLIEDGLKDKARQKLEDLIEMYPKTKSAEEARKELEKLKK